jgi:SAM-dependent methyltransferase
MPSISDKQYIQGSQYRTSSNLDARIRLHQRFSAATYGWSRWVYDHTGIAAGEAVLEVGCGPGNLWVENRDRLPEGARVVLADFSAGMTAAARAKLEGDARFRFLTADIQALPLQDSVCDLALANHMLYHVPDMRLGLQNLWRILKPGGRLVAATNGEKHLRELHQILRDFELSYPDYIDPSNRFGLQTGGAILGEVFDAVEVHTYVDSLWVTEPEPLVDYIYSMWSSELALQGHSREELTGFVAGRIARDGGILMKKETGVFTAVKELS